MYLTYQVIFVQTLGEILVIPLRFIIQKKKNFGSGKVEKTHN